MAGKFSRVITTVVITIIIIAVYNRYNGSVKGRKRATSKAVTGRAGARDLSPGEISTTCSCSQKIPWL